MLQGGVENAPLFECIRQTNRKSRAKSTTHQPEREMAHQRNIKRANDEMYRDVDDRISEESDQD